MKFPHFFVPNFRFLPNFTIFFQTPIKRFSMNYLDTLDSSNPKSWYSRGSRMAESSRGKRFSMNFLDSIDPKSKRFSMNFRDSLDHSKAKRFSMNFMDSLESTEWKSPKSKRFTMNFRYLKSF